LPTDTELAARAEAWRTKGFNKSPEQAAAWLETEKTKVRAEVEGRLARAEQRLLNKRPDGVQEPTAEAGKEPPVVDSDEAYRALASGSQFRAPDGQTYTKP
jgi:hypothetical protein